MPRKQEEKAITSKSVSNRTTNKSSHNKNRCENPSDSASDHFDRRLANLTISRTGRYKEHRGRRSSLLDEQGENVLSVQDVPRRSIAAPECLGRLQESLVERRFSEPAPLIGHEVTRLHAARNLANIEQEDDQPEVTQL